MNTQTLACLGLTIILLASEPINVFPGEKPMLWRGEQRIQVIIAPRDFGPTSNISNTAVRGIIKDILAEWRSGLEQAMPEFVETNPNPLDRLETVVPATRTELLSRRSERAIYFVYDELDALKLQPRQKKGEAAKVVLGGAYIKQDVRNDGLGVGVVVITKYGAESEAVLRSTLIHEIGHVLGLSHSLVFRKAELESGHYRSRSSAMFPFGRFNQIGPGDRAWMSFLYSQYAQDRKMSSDYAVLTGTLRKSNVRINGVNLIAVPTPDDGFRSSCMTGFSDVLGKFSIPVPPGDYYIYAESLPSHDEVLGLPWFIDNRGAVIGPGIYRERDGGVEFRVQARLGIRLRRLVQRSSDGSLKDMFSVTKAGDIVRVDPQLR